MKNFQLIICQDYQELSQKTAQPVFDKLEKKLPQKFVLGLMTGRTPVGFRKEFLKLLKLNKPSLKNLYLVNLDEYWPIKRDDPRSYFSEMKNSFWQPLEKLNLGFKQNQAFILNGEAKDPKKESAQYEKLLEKLGGVDLQMVGIGTEGHIGFNERGSLASSKTRLVKLSDSTLEHNKDFWSGKEETVPKGALTMGISTILKARKIVLLASVSSSGKKIKLIIDKFLKSRPTKNLPASFLKLHKDVTIIVDKEAYE